MGGASSIVGLITGKRDSQTKRIEISLFLSSHIPGISFYSLQDPQSNDLRVFKLSWAAISSDSVGATSYYGSSRAFVSLSSMTSFYDSFFEHLIVANPSSMLNSKSMGMKIRFLCSLVSGIQTCAVDSNLSAMKKLARLHHAEGVTLTECKF